MKFKLTEVGKSFLEDVSPEEVSALALPSEITNNLTEIEVENLEEYEYMGELHFHVFNNSGTNYLVSMDELEEVEE